ncbi:MAG: gamma-glutamyltransferase, partial [Hyphomicrobiales bacterium]
HIGAGTTAMPGMEAGLLALQGLSNKAIRTEDLYAAALKTAKEYKVSAFQARLFEIIEPILRATPDAEALFAPEGSLLKTGDVFENTQLRDVLRSLANESAKRLRGRFTGPDTLDFLQENGAHLTMQDVADYALEHRAPVSLKTGKTIQGTDIRAFAAPPPALGGTLALSMMSCMRQGGLLLDRLEAAMQIDKQWRDGCSAKDFSEKYGLAAARGKSEPAPSAFRGTTHISILDPYRNAIAVTLTNGEGNGLMMPNSGYMMNNMLGELDVNPAGPKGWHPAPKSKRRLSSMMAPMIVEDPYDGLLILGSGGSNRIRTALFQVLANRFGIGMTLKEAIELPRFHYEDGKIDVECASEQADVDAVLGSAKLNDHQVTLWEDCNMYFGGVNAVESRLFGNRTNHAWGDSRRDGAAIILD